MKTIRFTLRCNFIVAVVIFCLASTSVFSQVVKTPADTLKATSSDTLKAVEPAPIASETEKEAPKEKKEKKNKIVVYAGANFTDIGSSASYESEAETGYHLGVYYRQGRFVYWQAGARFATSVIGYKPGYSSSSDFTSVKISDLDLPLTLGLNLTSFMNRALAVRLFASAVPAFTLGVNDNTVGVTKDDLNSFIFYGQGGIGFDVAFLILEAGYNYGFNEIITDYPDTKPGQVFINLGFRF